MANQNQKVNGNGTTEQQVVQPEAQVAQQVGTEPQTVQQVVQPESKAGLGSWLKEHWKGATAAVVGLGTTIAATVTAYKKGKQAGMLEALPQQQPETEDYSLNPNN